MRPRLLVFFLALAIPVTIATAAVELTASGISVPFFDAAGKLTHRMAARRGVMAGPLQHLQEIEVVYFSATDPNVVVQRINAAEATWDDKKEILTGDDAILVATEDSRLTGQGFDFSLASSLLYIRRDFALTNREVVVTSDRATVDLIIERAGEDVKVRDVRRCEAIGNLRVVVQSTAQKTYPFERATSERAVYEGAAKTITFPEPIHYLRKGRELRSNTLTINLGDKPKK